MCNNVYNLQIKCAINNDDTYIAYVFPETYTEQVQKQTYCKPTKRLAESWDVIKYENFIFSF